MYFLFIQKREQALPVERPNTNIKHFALSANLTGIVGNDRVADETRVRPGTGSAIRSRELPSALRSQDPEGIRGKAGGNKTKKDLSSAGVPGVDLTASVRLSVCPPRSCPNVHEEEATETCSRTGRRSSFSDSVKFSSTIPSPLLPQARRATVPSNPQEGRNACPPLLSSSHSCYSRNFPNYPRLTSRGHQAWAKSS